MLNKTVTTGTKERTTVSGQEWKTNGCTSLGKVHAACKRKILMSEHLLQLPPITPHVCRHTYCTNMANSGMNPKTLQYLMGHSDISVTLNIYTHTGYDDAKKELGPM